MADWGLGMILWDSKLKFSLPTLSSTSDQWFRSHQSTSTRLQSSDSIYANESKLLSIETNKPNQLPIEEKKLIQSSIEANKTEKSPIELNKSKQV